MMYAINGTMINDAYEVDGTSLNIAYDIDADIVWQRNISYRHDILFTQDSMYVAYDGTTLSLSTDGGNTFTQSIDVSIVGVIKNIHVFTDGTLNVFGHVKAYYSDDWQTLHEATVLDASGNPYVFDTYDTFTVTRHNADRIVVDGVEMYVFGNYCITDEYNQKKNVWYTVDKGHTYKAAYEFGKTAVRHVHNVYFYSVDSSFWLTTGDSNAEARVMKGYYDAQNDSWSWSTLGTGYYYKWAGMDIYNGDVYWALDHTPGSVRKCAIADVSDTAKHSIVLDDTPNDCIGVVIDQDTGEMIVYLSIWGGTSETCRRIYYSTDRVNFEYVTGTVPSYYPYEDTHYYGVYGLNTQKKILSGLYSRDNDPLADWDKVPSIWLDDIVRSKFPNAFPQPVEE